jgi:ligand-binding SRPBCC domain-containing protein
MANTTFYLRVWTRFFDSPERVWAVKTDPDLLRAEFPAWARFSVRDAGTLQAAFQKAEPAQVDGRLSLLGTGPLGLRWPLNLEAVEPHTRYRDTSSNALYSRFEHEHLFEPTADGTRYIDAVTFTPSLPAAKAAAIFTQRLFVHRHRAAAKHLNADARTVGTAVLRVWVDDAAEDDAI